MHRLFDPLGFTCERLWQHRILVLWALVGLTAAVTLALSVVLYVDAVNTGLLETRVGSSGYSFRFRYLGSWNGNISREQVTQAASAVDTAFAQGLQLPEKRSVSLARGAAWAVRTEAGLPLGAFSLGTLRGANDQIEITAGEWSWDAEARSSDEPIPVLLPESVLYTMGISVGDLLVAARPGLPPLTVRVAALWRPINPDDVEWIFTPRFFNEVMLTAEADLWRGLEGIEEPIEEAAWFAVFDGGEVKTSDVDTLIGRISDGERAMANVLPGIRLDAAPTAQLQAFSDEVNRLSQQLLIVLLPVAGLVLYFVSLIAGLLVSRQAGEDITLRSRGMSRIAVLSVHALMWMLLTAAALGAALMFSPMLVQVVAQTSSFMRFDAGTPPLPVVLTPEALVTALITGLVAASSGLLLAWRSTRQTITGYHREANRGGKAWWQRLYLDVLLLIPAVYVLYTLSGQGGIVTDADNPFSDPLVFVGPTLFAFGLTLLFLRLLPFLLRLAADALQFSSSVALLMMTRELTRSAGRYRGTLLMMCFTLSLSGFTASMASTLDRSLADSLDYHIGADAALAIAADAQTEQSQGESGQTSYTVTGFNTLPASDLLNLESVEQVSRVGRYAAQLILPTQRLQGTALGIDRADIAAVARFREDYADMPVADLFNRLAGNRTGILISASTAAQYNLRINQNVRLEINALNTWYAMDVPIVGVLDYFPTLDPREGFFAVMNIDPIFETVGTPLPHDIWLSLAPDADINAVQAGVRELGFPVLEWRDPAAVLRDAVAQPARRGVLGFLSIGFAASVLLTLVAAVIQSAASFRAQASQLGALRAMGWSGAGAATYIVSLQGMIAGSGIASGTAIGAAATLLFLPLLDFSGGLPPYLVRVAWSDLLTVYGVFAGALLMVSFVMTLVLGRERLSAMVKLGDA